MYTFTECAAEGCTAYAITAAEHCLEHSTDSQSVRAETERHLLKTQHTKDLNSEGLAYSGIDLSSKELTVCRFSNASFDHVDFRKTTIRVCVFDLCTFNDCDFSGVDMKYCIFAGSRISDTTFSGSDILHTNFNGIVADNVTYDGSDLYFSTFIGASLTHCGFSDCNLRKTRFLHTTRDDVVFKYSNYEEAEFGEEPVR